MIMLFRLLTTTGLLLVPVITVSDRTVDIRMLSEPSLTKQRREATPLCLTQTEIVDLLRNLSASESTSEQEGIVATLRKAASSSSGCRRQVVTTLIAALENADRDLLLARSSFFLWHYGSKLLADLKAVEALDLFIRNFDLHDGTPFPFNHHPSIRAVIDIGEEAIPALRNVLTKSSSDETKRYAVFCLAQIGGNVAKKALQERLGAESNCCIRDCIGATLKAFQNKALPNHITSESRSNWYASFMCDCDPSLRIKIESNR